MIIDFSVLKVGHYLKSFLRGYGFICFDLPLNMLTLENGAFDDFRNQSIFRIIEFSKLYTNLSINKNLNFSSESWFGAPKDPMLIEI